MKKFLKSNSLIRNFSLFILKDSLKARYFLFEDIILLEDVFYAYDSEFSSFLYFISRNFKTY